MMEDFYVPTDIQFKDDLRKEEIKLEELLNLYLIHIFFSLKIKDFLVFHQ